MTWMNEYEIDVALNLFNDPYTPNLNHGVEILAALARWADNNSDGWAYWPKPARSAKALMELLNSAQSEYYKGNEVLDCSPEDITRVCRPIKSFLTRNGASFEDLF